VTKSGEYRVTLRGLAEWDAYLLENLENLKKTRLEGMDMGWVKKWRGFYAGRNEA
jgi:hypothetical protein